MGFYKFVEDDVADLVAAGCFKLGSLHYYRLLEIMSGNRFIGDVNDGRKVSNVALLDSSDPLQREKMKKMGFIVEGNSQIIMENTTVGRFSDDFILSLAYGEIDALAEEFAKERGGVNGYGSAIEITDVEAFADLLALAEIKQPISLAGKRLGDAFDSLACAEVIYQDNSNSATDDFDANIFQKDPFFAFQKEYRIAVRNTPRFEDDAIIVQVHPDAIGLIKLVRKGKAITKKTVQRKRIGIAKAISHYRAASIGRTDHAREKIFARHLPIIALNYWDVRHVKKDRDLERAMVRRDRKRFDLLLPFFDVRL